MTAEGSAQLRERLLVAGVDRDDVDAAEAGGHLAMLALDRLLLPGRPRYAKFEAARRAGVDDELATKLWRALGFADVADDEQVFTDVDVDALGIAARYLRDGLTDEESVVQTTRVLGASMARVAETQVSAIAERLADVGLVGDDAVAFVIGFYDDMHDDMLRLFALAHRRHLLAVTRRAPFLHEGEGGTGNVLAVGFADLVGFTVLSQELSEHELGQLVAEFESSAYDLIAQAGGRIVKMIGDEVMFVADDVAAAAVIALTLVERYRHDELTDVRVGLAHGPVIAHEGDYFGPVVNLASRIVNIAYAGSVVVSDEVHDSLRDRPEFGWKSIRPHRLKGIGVTPLWVLQRAGDDGEVVGATVRKVREHRNR